MKTIFRRFPAAAALLTALGSVPFAFAAPPQSVAITAPANNASVSVSSTSPTVTITATAVASTGSAAISSIDFRVNGVSIGTLVGGAANVTLNFPWQPTAIGTYTLTAIASDSSSATGNTLTSSPITVNVTSVRLASVVAPVSNAALPSGSQVFLRSTASMSDGIIAKVDFVLDPSTANTVIATATQAPYNAPYSVTASAGAHTILARVTASDLTTTYDSATTNFSVVAPVGTPPTAAMTAPTAGNFVATGAATTLTATAASTNVGGFVQSVTFFVDGDPVGTDLTAPYSASWTPTIAKSYSLRAMATDDKGNTTLASAVTVTAVSALPTVAITAPTAGASLTTSTVVNITGTATPSSAASAITNVTFYANGVAVGPPVTGAPPYTIAWTTPATAGSVALVAQVLDNAGLIATSSTVTVNVGTASPTISVTAPVAGAVVGLGVPVPLTATATANGGATITKVDFLVGTALVGTATTFPYTVNWTPTAAGSASITARVTDSNNVVVTSAPVAVTVGGAPTIAITSPTAGTSLPAGLGVTISANAAATTGATVQSVQFFVNGGAIGTDNSAPYSTTWTPTVSGANVLSAQVTDSLGVTTTSANVSVTVTGGTTTLASVLTMTGSTSIPAGSTRALSATVSGGSGSYDRVELYYDTVLVGSDTSAPYTFLFTAPAAVGNHFLYARVVDANGLSADSNVIPISLSPTVGVAPVAAILTPASGSFLGVNAATTITGAATDADGSVTGVQVFVNGASIGSAVISGGTWSINWTPTVVGTASITAIATDNSGNAVAAPAVGVSITDSSSPGISLALTPAFVGSATTLPSGATRNIVANVTPAAGRAVVRVEFFVDGTKIGEDTSFPFTFRYTAPPLASGESSRAYVLSARATDNAGAARDVLQPLLVVSPIGQPPTINLITPANNAAVVPNTDVSLAVSAVATGGTVASVQFYVNGNPLLVNNGNPITAAPYTGVFRPTAAGAYVIDAIVTDDRGNTAVSTAANITAAFATPSIVFTAPNPNAVARGTPGVPLTLSATATVQTGTGASILLVEFLLDGAQIGADTTAPYSISWIPTAAHLGTRVLTARVTDTNSQTATSPPLTINVANVVGSPPTVNVVAAPIPAQGLQTVSTVNFLATAVATGGSTLSNVEIFLNDISIGLAAREQATNVYRVSYSLTRFDFTTVTPTINDATGAVTYPVRLYAIARDSNNNQTVSATTNLVINPATSNPPAIQLQALTPTNINVGTQFFMAANAADPDGIVTTIQLYANGQQVGVFPNPQQGALLTFTPNNAGNFNLYAVATDDTGNTAVSTPSIVVNVTAIAAPSTTLTRPSNDATITTANAPVFLEGTAVNNATTQVPTLQFVVTSSLGIRQQFAGIRVNANSTSYRTIWTPTVADTYTVTTQASVGIVQGTSPVTRRVVVNSIQGLAPTISLTRAPGVSGFPGTATTASTADLAATATDPDGSIVSVEFFLDRNSIGQARRDPQGNTWRLTTAFAGLQPGNIEIVALATDNSGNVVASPTGNINITAPSSIAPSITITPSTVSPAFNRAVQLRANARDSDGTVNSVQYFANATSIATSTNAGSLFLSTWTPTESGTYLLYAVATDNTGITRVSDTVEVNVRRNNPVLENAAFILQTYQDIANTTNINPLVFDQLDEQLGGGSLTRADLIVAPLTANGGLALTELPGFQAPVNLLATYYVLMGHWPTPQNYTTFLNIARANLGAAVGSILSANEYFAKYGFVPTNQILDTPTSPNNAEAFLARLHVAAGLPPPQALDRLRFRSNNTLSATLGRGYAAVGLNQAIAEFVTNTNSTNTALFDRARAAALFYQLARPPVTVTVDEITARIDALLRLPSRAAIADAVLKDVLYGYRFVTITKHPQSLAVAPRSGVILTVEAQGAPPLAYQWLLNGAPVPGATNTILSLTNVDATRAGTYTVAITSSAATATSDAAVLTINNTPTRLANISTRGVTTGDGTNVLIGGFVVQGANATQTRQMLIRVIGPTLTGAPFNLAGALANPRLEVYTGNNQTPVLVNDDWGQQTGGQQQVTAIQQAVQRAGAFNFAGPNSADAAVLVTLPPGTYTVQAKGPLANLAATGIVLIEVYDVTQGAAAGPKAANVSTRGNVGTGANALIAGFVVNGAVSRRILIRGVGPTLANFGVPGVLADPQITLTNQVTGQVLATNDNWASGVEAPIIAQASVAAGAFPLANGSRDSAMIVMLPPGAYTVTLSGVNNGTGVGIVEVYDVDP